MNVWETDFGSFILPDDFPMQHLTKRGWLDKRRKDASAIETYISQQTEKLISGVEKPGFKAPMFNA